MAHPKEDEFIGSQKIRSSISVIPVIRWMALLSELVTEANGQGKFLRVVRIKLILWEAHGSAISVCK